MLSLLQAISFIIFMIHLCHPFIPALKNRPVYPIKVIINCLLPVKIMWLKELGPKFRFGHLVRYIINMFLSHCRICFEYGIYDVLCEVVFEAITAISLGLDIREKGSRYTLKNKHVWTSYKVLSTGHASFSFHTLIFTSCWLVIARPRK